VRIAEQEEVRTRRQSDVERPVSSNRSVYRAEACCLVGRAPYGKRHTTSRHQHAKGLTHRCVGVRKMTHPEVAYHGIEAVRGKRQRVGIALFESDLGISIPCQGH